MSTVSLVTSAYALPHGARVASEMIWTTRCGWTRRARRTLVLQPPARGRTALSVHARPVRFQRAAALTIDSKAKGEAESGPVQLATARLKDDVDANELLGLLRGWANSLNAQGMQPLQLSLKVDNITSGVRLALIEVRNGAILDLVYYDMTVLTQDDGTSIFMATRDGEYRSLTPPDEPAIFGQLQSFLKTAIPACRR